MRQRRRIITRAIVSLLLGAMVNVAVAWGIAMFTEVPSLPMPLFMRSDSSHWWDHHPRGGPRLLAAWRYCMPGFDRRDMLGCEPRAATITVNTNSWTIMSRPNTPFERSTVISTGWPAQCLRGEQWADNLASPAAIPGSVTPRGSIRGRLIWAYAIDTSWRNKNESCLLPLQPLWPGFAINTLFYAAILWLLFAAPFALRRRRRIKRGLCPACAYPVGIRDTCTECGTTLKRIEMHP